MADQPPFDKDNTPKNDGAEPRPKLSVNTGGPRVTPADPNARPANPAGPRPYTPSSGQSRPAGTGSPRPFTPGGGQNRPSSPGAPRPFTPGGAPRPFTPGGAPRPFTPGGAAPGGRPQRGRYVPREERLEHRINDLIRIEEGRLVGDNLEDISTEIGQTVETGIFPLHQLMSWAEKAGLDLVETVPNATPPVVRIIDYNKFVYNKRKKEKELKANAAKTVLKEIRFGPNTDDHDFEFKTKHAREFLSKGDKVKAFVQFKGRAIVFKERGELLLLKFIKELEDVCSPEQLPKLEGRRMIVMLTPKKTSKK